MPDLYHHISRYNEYIILGIHYHIQGNRAPFAAYEKPDGTITGFLYVNGEDLSYSLSADDVVKQLHARFQPELAAGRIRSYIVLYHFINDDGSGSIEIVHNEGTISLPYTYEDDSVSYTSFASFTKEQNAAIFQTQVTRDSAELFADREEIVSPVSETGIGQRLTWSNTLTTGNIWSGILGFTTYQEGKGVQTVQGLFAQTIANTPVVKDGVSVHRMDFEDLSFQVTAVEGVLTKSFIPVIHTDLVLDVENKEIMEWANAANLEAVITGSGKDTFVVSYFATDYAQHKGVYTSQGKLGMRLSGLVYVLDTFQKTSGYSEDFTGYFPNSDLAKAGCFDFIGQLEDFRETSGLGKGYLMRVRLITSPVNFTIDMYVVAENMRFEELKKGMKITGMVQLLGEIAR
jgi:hypothetical protein